MPAGVYTLDIITQKGNTRGAYEVILVLDQELTDPQTNTIIERQVIRERRNSEDIEIIFKAGDSGSEDLCIENPEFPECPGAAAAAGGGGGAAAAAAEPGSDDEETEDDGDNGGEE